MNDLADLLSADSIDDNLGTTTKKQLFQHLAAVAARRVGIPAKEILTCLNDRERLGSTGFGGGIAIPHGKLDGLGTIFGYFARLQTPIDFHSVDGLPVDLVFLLLSPSDAGADHLKALASVSRALRDRQMLAKLRGARSRDAIYAVLAGSERQHAA
jgi:PTS system nitrogen regulatory IIA component